MPNPAINGMNCTFVVIMKRTENILSKLLLQNLFFYGGLDMSIVNLHQLR